MRIRNILATILILGIGGALAYVVMNTNVMQRSAGQSDAHGGHGDEEEHEEFARGPHGGRLLESDGIDLEVTIYETGMPPQFRIYPFEDGTPLPLEEVDLRIDLLRFGGRVDAIAFTPENDYLRGIQVVAEPHSFDAHVMARRGERSFEWDFESYEGRLVLSPEAAAFAEIETTIAGPATLRTTLSLPGEIALNADKIVHIVPRVEGVVRSVEKNLGESIERGGVLAVIDSRELADAKSSFLAATELQKLAQAHFDREEKLYAKKVTSEDEYITVEHHLIEAEINTMTARQKLLALGLSVDEVKAVSRQTDMNITSYEIRSPMGGVVIQKHITGGEAIGPDSSIFIVADLSEVWVEISVYAQDLGRIRNGQPVVIRSKDLGAQARGTVSYIGPLIGEDTRSAKAIVVLANPDGQWRPGLYVTVEVLEEESIVPIAVPVEAIQSFRDWSVVFAKQGTVYEIKPLELGRSDGVWIEVLEGLEAGEEYVVRNSYVIKADLEKSGAAHSH